LDRCEINSENVTNYFLSLPGTLISRISMNCTDFINLRIYIICIVPFANRSGKYERRALKVACRMKYGTEIRAAHDKTLSTLNVYPGSREKQINPRVFQPGSARPARQCGQSKLSLKCNGLYLFHTLFCTLYLVTHTVS